MIRGLYTAAAGMIANERQQEVVATDVSNMTTPGYKSDEALLRSFPETLVYSMSYDHGGLSAGSGSGSMLGTMGSGVYVDEVLSRFDQGTLHQSDNPYAMAIEDTPQSPNDPSRGFFAVAGPGQTAAFSRDGDFHLNVNNWLTTPSGRVVLGVGANGQPIVNSAVRVNPAFQGKAMFDAVGRAVVDQNGNASFTVVDQTTGQPVQAAGGAVGKGGAAPRFGFVQVNDARKLVRAGDGTYLLGGANFVPLRSAVKTSFVEQSNVDPARVMVSMESVMRSYEANQRVVRTMDSSLDKAVNDIGRVQSS